MHNKSWDQAPLEQPDLGVQNSAIEYIASPDQPPMRRHGAVLSESKKGPRARTRTLD